MFRLVVRLLMSYLHMQFSGELPRKNNHLANKTVFTLRKG